MELLNFKHKKILIYVTLAFNMVSLLLDFQYWEAERFSSATQKGLH